MAREIAPQVDYPEEWLEYRRDEPRYFEAMVGGFTDRMNVDVDRDEVCGIVASILEDVFA